MHIDKPPAAGYSEFAGLIEAGRSPTLLIDRAIIPSTESWPAIETESELANS